MACLDMYNSSLTPSHQPPMSPRISFSNDFVESHNNNNNNNNNLQQLNNSRSEVAASMDFEFSNVTNYSMMSADELFFKGKILPFKDNNNGGNTQLQRTLRDELLTVDDDDDDDDDNDGNDIDFSLKPPKADSSNRWKGFLGLRMSHIGSKKTEKSDVSFDAAKTFAFAPQLPNLTKSPQDMVSNEGSSSTDMEMGI